MVNIEKTGTTDITQNSVLLTLKLRRPGNRRRVNTSLVEVDADKDAVQVNKELLDSPELKEIISHDGKVRQWLYGVSLPAAGTLREGVYRLPLTLVEEIERRLNGMLEAREELIEKFMGVYERQVGEAKARLRSLYRDTDYPISDDVRDAFRMEWRYLVLGVPEALEKISSQMFANEKAKASAAVQAEVDEIRDALRTSFADLLDHAVERLGKKKDGKPKVFRDTLVGNMEDFLRYFGDRNIVNDTELEAMVEKARVVLKGIKEPKVLRDDMKLRGRTKKAFGQIRMEMDKAEMLKPTRKFRFEDDDE